MRHVHRHLKSHLERGLGISPVVFLNGPRQAGKSTLVQEMISPDFPAEYVTFDHVTQMAAATAAPMAYLSHRKGPLIIDEVQMVPEIFRALKSIVDTLRLQRDTIANGRFLLTGSANIMALPALSDALVGRMSVMTLYPLASCELFGGKGTFLESLFAMDFQANQDAHSLNQAISGATFPEIAALNAVQRALWCDGYVTTLLQRDVRMLAEIEKLSKLPLLLHVLATQVGNLLNEAAISRAIGLNAVTCKNYRTLFKALFLTFDIPPFHRNLQKRLVKAPKGYLVDVNLLCHLLDWHLENISPSFMGHVVENFVASELVKLLSFGTVRAQLMHFRTQDQREVDFVLECPDGRVAGIEVKNSESLGMGDFSGLKELSNLVGDDFIGGIVLYRGRDIVPFGNNLLAVPLSCLWQ